ncbi:MAG: hypothetical protein S4CHLAM81_14390 [Chlamydiales bacterium]|nr:hypothetical protein [Chlamydiales bacterium]MCH9636211.1 hypothetical protein [Chlamydiales bacterium]MCH9703803.1 ABC transporter permease subunit [Chlamydiota bacterium]
MQSNKQVVWNQFKKNKIGFCALLFFVTIFLLGVYAPLLCSSKPLVVLWKKRLYFPLFRYLFYSGFYTKPIDLFFNLLMFTLPLFILFRKKRIWALLTLLQLALFLFFLSGGIKDPSSNQELRDLKSSQLNAERVFREDPVLAPIMSYPTWERELKYMTDHAKLSVLLKSRLRKKQHDHFAPYRERYFADTGQEMPTLWHTEQVHERQKKVQLAEVVEHYGERYALAMEKLPELIAEYRPFSHDYLMAKYEFEQARELFEKHSDALNALDAQMAKRAVEKSQQRLVEAVRVGERTRLPLVEAKSVIQSYRDAVAQSYYLEERSNWIEQQSQSLKVLIAPFLRPFHWEDDAGGSQLINRYVPWTERTRINRKDLLSSLLFGIRVSLVVGVSAVFLSLMIGIPLGTISGYFAGKADLVICRLVEIWEAMPTFFMLLLVVAVTQSKSIFLVIAVLGIFGWTSFCRFIRAEVLRQRSLPYVLATKSLGYRHSKIMFSHILPNAIPPILTLLPFALMAAITSEAGLSFLGLGEEGSSSWGVLMDEGRSVFPGESYLLWPPAILLTLLLVSIALIGDVLRDALDPKLRS